MAGFLFNLGSFQPVEPGSRDFNRDIRMIIKIGMANNNAESIQAANWLFPAHSYNSGVTDLIRKYVMINEIIPELTVFPPTCLIKPNISIPTRITAMPAATGPKLASRNPVVAEKTDMPMLRVKAIPMLMAFPPRPVNFLLKTNCAKPVNMTR